MYYNHYLPKYQCKQHNIACLCHSYQTPQVFFSLYFRIFTKDSIFHILCFVHLTPNIVPNFFPANEILLLSLVKSGLITNASSQTSKSSTVIHLISVNCLNRLSLVRNKSHPVKHAVASCRASIALNPLYSALISQHWKQDLVQLLPAILSHFMIQGSSRVNTDILINPCSRYIWF